MQVMELFFNYKTKYNQKGPSRAVAREILSEYCRIHQISSGFAESISRGLDKIEEVDEIEEEEEEDFDNKN